MFKQSVLQIITKPEFTHSIWVILGQVVVAAAAFLLTYILANFVSADVVGEFRFLIALQSTISVLALIGLGTALNQSVANGYTGSYWEAVKLKIKYGQLGTLVFLAVAGYYFLYTDETQLAYSLIILGLLFSIIETFNLYSSYLQGLSKFKASSILLGISRISIVVAIAAVIYFSNSLISITFVYFVIAALTSYSCYVVSKNIHQPNNQVDKEMLPYAKHLTLMSVIGAITTQLDKYILFIFFGPAALANFWVASTIPQEVNRGMAVIVSTFFPRFVKSSRLENIRVVRRLFLLASMIGLAVVTTYFLVANIIFSYVFPQYIEVVTLSVALMFAFGFVPYYFVWQVFSAQKDVRVMYILNIAEPLLIILFYLAFIPQFGIMGIVYSLILKNTLFNLHALYYLSTK